MASRTLNIVLAGRTKGIESAFGKVGRVVGATAKTLGAVGLAAGAAGAAFGGKALSNAAKLEKQLAEVRTLLPDLTDDGFKKLQEQVLAFSNDMGIATDEAIPALYQAISAGVPPDNVIGFLETAGQASIGGLTSLETAVDGITSVVNAYGSEAISAGKASNILFTAVRLGKTNFNELSSGISQVAPLAASMGISFEDVTAAVTQVTKAGVPTQQVMTQIRSLIQSLAAPTKESAELFGELGIDVNATRLANEGFLPVLQDIIEKTEGNESAQRKLFGSVEALQGALAIVSGDGESFSEILAGMHSSASATENAFGTMADTSAYKLQTALTRVNNLFTVVGAELLPLVASALEFLLPKLQAAATWLGQNVGPAIATVGSFLSENLGPALTTVRTVIAEQLVPALTGIFRELSENLMPVFRGLWEFLSQTLVPLIAETLIPVLKAIGEQAFSTIVDLWKNTLKPAVQEIIALFGSEEGGDSVGGVVKVLRKTFEFVFGAIQLVVTTVIDLIANRIRFIITVAKEVIEFLAAVFRGDWEAAWQSIQDIAFAAWEFIKSTIEIALGFITGLFILFGIDIERVLKTAWEKVQTGATGFGNALKSGFKSVVNSIISSIEAIPNAFITGMNAMIGAWNRFSIRTPGVKVLGETVIPSITFDTPDIPTIPKVKIPRLAEGGIVRATPGGVLANLGEGRYDEAVLPLDGRGYGNQTINLEINIYAEDGLINLQDLREQLTEWVNVDFQRGAIVTNGAGT